MATQDLPLRLPSCRQAVAALQANTAVQKALSQIEAQAGRRIEEQIALTETPAPSFAEEERARLFKSLLKKAGLPDVHFDAVGNVIGRMKGTGSGPVLVIGAHLDTVFPAGTEIKVRQEGTRYFAPGISDDACGLANLLQVVRAITENGIRPTGDIVFVGTLGEEGNGDLRGSKALWKTDNDYDGFIAVDSASPKRILKGSVGCKRFRITYTGPGGHSLHKFGIVGSAAHALCRAGAMIADLDAPKEPKCTYNIGVIKGGTSVNAIAATASMELDVRSYEQGALETFVSEILPIFQKAADAENRHWSVAGGAAVTVTVDAIGDRPAGMNLPDSPVVCAAYEAMTALNIPLEKFTLGATDQNIPLSMGYPATTLGGGGAEENNHSLKEVWDAADAHLGPQLVMLTALALVGADGISQPVLAKHRH